MGEITNFIFAGTFVVFVGSQSYYFLIGVLSLGIYFSRPEMVRSEEPAEFRTINILIPLYQEPRPVVEATIETITSSDYPSDLLNLYLIHESGDEATQAYLDRIVDAHQSGLHIETVCVVESDTVCARIRDKWEDGGPLPRTKARALNYALYDKDLDGVITVLDADTLIPASLLRQGVAGLEQYDVVQAKQTVRNIDAGLLPLLEAPGMIAWCEAVFPGFRNTPYQLLGKGYFIEAELLYDLGGWNPYTPTEDMALGVSAYLNGRTLGVINAFTEDLCPRSVGPWITQKRRWLSGPYRALQRSELNTTDRVAFGFETLGLQLVPLVNVVGIPSGLLVLMFWLTGSGYAFSPLLTGLLVFNGTLWIGITGYGYWRWHTVCSYPSVPGGCHFESIRDELVYFSKANIITQLGYATLWAVPIIQAFSDFVAGVDVGFEVTRKRPESIGTETPPALTPGEDSTKVFTAGWDQIDSTRAAPPEPDRRRGDEPGVVGNERMSAKLARDIRQGGVAPEAIESIKAGLHTDSTIRGPVDARIHQLETDVAAVSETLAGDEFPGPEEVAEYGSRLDSLDQRITELEDRLLDSGQRSDP